MENRTKPVIVAIADDFTGAAEVAAVGLRYGLKPEVQTSFFQDTAADLLVIDTCTRSKSVSQTAARLADLFTQLRPLPTAWIYKKVDSVLRGPVAAELETIAAFLKKDRILLLPANPSLGRQIRRGFYFVNAKPLHETDFAKDPEYPATSSEVLKLLGRTRSLKTLSLNQPQSVPAGSLAIADARSHDDVLAWAQKLDDLTLPAGAAEFFATILETRGLKLSDTPIAFEHPKDMTSLFVCTSPSSYSRKAIEQAKIFNVPLCEMPPHLFETEKHPRESIDQWVNDAADAFTQSRAVLVAINRPVSPSRLLARKLCCHTGDMIYHLMKKIQIQELYIEGGATASAIFNRFEWQRFFPSCEIAPGVIRMSLEAQKDFHVTVKPGSYRWPDNIWHFTKKTP